MKLNKLDWDSTFFGFEVAEMCVDSNEVIFENDKFDLIYIKANSEFKFISTSHIVTLEEHKVEFEKTLYNDNCSFVENNYIEDLFIKKNVNKEAMYSLAFESGKYSRFKKDNIISKDKFEALYKLWIDNSLNKKFADAFFVYVDDEQILGFVTVKLHQNFGQIGLIAVAPGYQGKGIGSKLIMKAEEFCLQNNKEKLQIPTQKENIEACSFYSKLDYKIIKTTIIKHAHSK